MDLTDEQWRLIEPLIPVPLRRADGRGRPRCNPCEVMNRYFGGLCALVQPGLTSRVDTHPARPVTDTSKPGSVFIQILNVLAEDLYARGQIDLAVSTAHLCRPNRGRCRRERGKGSKIMAIPGLPIAIHISSASSHEPQLVEPRLFCGG